MNPEEIIALKQTVARLVERQITAYVNMLCVGEGTANVQRILIAEDALGGEQDLRDALDEQAARRSSVSAQRMVNRWVRSGVPTLGMESAGVAGPP